MNQPRAATDAIALDGVTKTFGEKVAVDDVSLRIPRGALYGLIGPNGAGKTTTIRMIMSILFPDAGTVRVLGHPSALEAKDRTGYLPEDRGLYKKMRVGALLRYMARLKGVPSERIGPEVRRWLERVELPDVEKKRCEELSKGMQQKVQFISAAIHEPELLILDEPFSGLDPLNRRLLHELIAEEHERGATIIFSTHVMVHAEEICDHIVMIDGGRKVLDEALVDIKSRFDPRSITFEPLHADADLEPISRVEGVESINRNETHAEIHLVPTASPEDAMPAIAAAVPPARLEINRPDLEEVFIQLVGSGDGDAQQTLREKIRETPEEQS